MTRRTMILAAVLAGSLVLVAGWSYGYMASERAEAASAQADLGECRRMVREMQLLSRRPALAAEHERQTSEIIGLIEKAAGEAGVPAENIERITPEMPRRIGDTAYKETPTRVHLRKISLQQLVTLTHALLSADAGLRADSIRLTSPRQAEGADQWTTELVLGYLIYDPTHAEK